MPHWKNVPRFLGVSKLLHIVYKAVDLAMQMEIILDIQLQV